MLLAYDQCKTCVTSISSHRLEWCPLPQPASALHSHPVAALQRLQRNDFPQAGYSYSDCKSLACLALIACCRGLGVLTAFRQRLAMHGSKAWPQDLLYLHAQAACLEVFADVPALLPAHHALDSIFSSACTRVQPGQSVPEN